MKSYLLRPSSALRPSSPMITASAVVATVALVIKAYSAVFCGTVASAGEGARGDRFEQIRTQIRAQVETSQVASISVAVAQDGKMVWQEAFGWADRARQQRADTDTMYSLASISKSITATALMTLVEQGKVKLDDPVNRYLGKARVSGTLADANSSTVRRVANHSSGLPPYHQFFYDDEPSRPPSMDATIERSAVLVDVPGEQFVYSNLGYGMLGHLIATVSGTSFDAYLRDEVFIPLRLFHMSTDAPRNRRAIRYDKDGRALPGYVSDTQGAADLWSSATDLARFGLFHLKAHLSDQRPILSDATIDAMQQPGVFITPGLGYGIGWKTEDRSGYRVVSSDGGMPGASTAMKLVPSKGLVIVVLANSRSRFVYSIADSILTSIIRDNDDGARTQARDQPSASRLTGTWAGSVHTQQADIPLKIVFPESGLPQARLGSEPEVALNDFRPTGDGHVTARMKGNLGAPELMRRPYTLVLYFKERGGELGGALIAVSDDGGREAFELPYAAKLRRLPPINR